MQNIFDKCPACGGQLIITECRCSQCQLQMRGEFRPGRFLNLSDDELTFIEVFLSTRGNLSEVERTLGVSYPTVRNKLDEINEILQRTSENTEPVRLKNGGNPTVGSMSAEESRKRILQDVADGKLSPVAAVEKLGDTSAEGD